MKIFDCCMYFDEDVILDIRLNTLSEQVDYFVIVESKFTHKGEERKLKFDLKNLLNTLHPTPAVCGLPKEAAKFFILQNEKYDRTYYSGFLGEINDDFDTELFVNLRCAKIEKNVAQIYVGGGITKESNPEKEWSETHLKTNTIKSIL